MKNNSKQISTQISPIFPTYYGILIICGSGSDKTNMLLNLIKHR